MWRRLVDRFWGVRKCRVTTATATLRKARALRDACVLETRMHWRADPCPPSELWPRRIREFQEQYDDFVAWVLGNLQPNRRERQALADADLI